MADNRSITSNNQRTLLPKLKQTEESKKTLEGIAKGHDFDLSARSSRVKLVRLRGDTSITLPIKEIPLKKGQRVSRIPDFKID